MKNRSSFLKSFVYAVDGIIHGIKNERNVRIHISVMIVVCYFARFYGFSKTEWILILLTCLAVISLEMVNTAIEAVMDKVSPEYSTQAKIAKDTAAGGVLVAAVLAAIIGGLLFWDVKTLTLIWNILSSDITECIKILLLFVSLWLFITLYKYKKI